VVVCVSAAVIASPLRPCVPAARFAVSLWLRRLDSPAILLFFPDYGNAAKAR